MTHTPLQDLHPLTALLPIQVGIVTLRFIKPTKFPFFHHVPLNAFIRNLLGSPPKFHEVLITDPLENGRIHFNEGDLYRFKLITFGDGQALGELILHALQGLPNSAANFDTDMAFGPHFMFESCVDGLLFDAPNPVSYWQELSVFEVGQLQQHVELWQDFTHFRWQCVTPLQITKLKKPSPPDAPKKTNKKIPYLQRYAREASDFSWTLLQQRFFDSIIHLIQQHTGTRFNRPTLTEGELHKPLSFWVDLSYGDYTINNKTVGGCLARTDIVLKEPLPEMHWVVMVLTQMLGMGTHRAFGMGQFQFMTPEGHCSYPRLPHNQPGIEQALNPQHLEQVFTQASAEDKRDHSCQDNGVQQTSFRQWTHIETLAQQVIQNDYSFPPLQAVTLEEDDGDQRQLSIPPWSDRVLQKACAQWLTPALDKLYRRTSYGYRRGYSRQQARDAITQKLREGYEWVLESDVKSFFDSVSWENLEQRLQLLFPQEPLVDRLMDWVKADRINEQGQRSPRQQGLPQGSPISPMLANLLLDDLDQDMAAREYTMMRFADDFVLLFKRKQQAEAALPHVLESLNAHGLSVNTEKTRIVSAKDGFHYLGYLFVDGYAIERKAKSPKPTSLSTATDSTTKRSDISKSNTDSTIEWDLHSRESSDSASETHTEIKTSTASTTSTTTTAPEEQSIGERTTTLGLLLMIVGERAMLFSQDGRVVVEQEDQAHQSPQRHSYPWQNLSAILMLGPHHITTPALRDAMTHQVPVHFASAYGQYEGACWGQDAQPLGVMFWQQQSKAFTDDSTALQFSKTLIEARVHHLKTLIRIRNKDWEKLTQLNRLQTQVKYADSLEQLRGFEGQASKLLFEFFKHRLPKDWGFNHRNRQPPKDPVNALLSYGYTFLYSIMGSLIHVIGLTPWQGFYHQQHGRHQALASDMMEPFRHIVESTVLSIINRQQLKPDDFAITQQGCQMSTEARKTFMRYLLAAFTQHRGQQHPITEHMRQQLWSLVLACRQGPEQFRAWRG